MNALNILSIVVCVLLLLGYANRRRRVVHITIMVTALVVDLAMVLFLELTRGVIESLPGRTMTPLLAVHILISVVVLVLYTIQVVTGIKKARGGPGPLHGKMPLWVLLARFGNLITSFLVI